MRIENETVPPSSRAQTLERGIAALEVVALADAPRSIDDVAAALGLHRSIVYRLLRTLEDRGLVERDAAGRFWPGLRLAVLAKAAHTPLRDAAAPQLAALAEGLGMTAFLVVRDGDEVVTVDVAEPRRADVHVAYRPGARHPVSRGAPGTALLAAAPPLPDEGADVRRARRRGWASSHGEVLPGMASVAAPVRRDAALAVLWLAAQPVDAGAAAAAVVAAAARVAARLDADGGVVARTGR
jgi:DNA-binding IclR family transcriptional regulator